jgi:hypothetical protein
MSQVKCTKECGWIGDTRDCSPIDDIWERVEPGEIFPAGQCPKCGLLVAPALEDMLAAVPAIGLTHELISYLFVDTETGRCVKSKALDGAGTIEFLYDIVKRHRMEPDSE